MRLREHRWDDAEGLAQTLADFLADDLSRAIADRGRASLVVSGGGTPIPLFRKLRRKILDWSRVRITLADERWVAPDHPDSNEASVREELLRDHASPAIFVPLKNDAATPEQGQAACELALSSFRFPLDVVVLGMGADGHTASLFPGAPELPVGLDLRGTARCVAVRPPIAPLPRISLTLSALLDSRRRILHITGSDKREVFARALDEGPVEDLPIRAVLRNAPSLDLFWSP